MCTYYIHRGLPCGWIREEEWAIIGFWDQFWHENMHSYFFSLNLVILKPRIYSQLRYLQLLGNQFGKKTKLRMWCTFFCQNREKSWFRHVQWQRLDVAYLSVCDHNSVRLRLKA